MEREEGLRPASSHAQLILGYTCSWPVFKECWTFWTAHIQHPWAFLFVDHPPRNVCMYVVCCMRCVSVLCMRYASVPPMPLPPNTRWRKNKAGTTLLFTYYFYSLSGQMFNKKFLISNYFPKHHRRVQEKNTTHKCNKPLQIGQNSASSPKLMISILLLKNLDLGWRCVGQVPNVQSVGDNLNRAY